MKRRKYSTFGNPNTNYQVFDADWFATPSVMVTCQVAKWQHFIVKHRKVESLKKLIGITTFVYGVSIFSSLSQVLTFLSQHQQQIATTVQLSFIYLEVSITEPFICNITCLYLASESSTNPFLWFF